MSFFSFGLARKLFECNDAVSELDEICMMFVDAKSIHHFVIICDVILVIRDIFGGQNDIFWFFGGTWSF